MATYHTEELTFDVPLPRTDLSLNVFYPARAEADPITVTISREPRTEGTFEEQVGKAIALGPRIMPGASVIARRSKSIGHLPGVEVKMTSEADGEHLYHRQAYVDWFGTVLLLHVTGPRALRERVDETADAILDGVRFRKAADSSGAS